MPSRTSPEKEQTYLRNVSAKKVAVTETITIPAGAAGVCVDFDVTTRPISSSTGADLGGVGNTSFVLTSTAFATLVNFKEDADLANGEYYLDHLTGKGRGKKADSSTSGTAAFSVFALKTILETGDIELGSVELKDGTTDTRATINAANTARTIATTVLVTQTVDEAGNVLGKTAADAARTTATKVQPSQEVDPAGNTALLHATLGDAESNSRNRYDSDAHLMGFNETTWDRLRAGITAVTGTLTGWLNMLPWAIYHTTPTTRTNGQGGPLQADVDGNLKVTIAGQSAGSALADATANPTTTSNGSLSLGFNGTTWDRVRAGITAATTTVTGWLNVIPGWIYSTSKPTLTNGQYSSPQCNVNGALDTNDVLMPAAEDNVIGVLKVENRYSYGRVVADGQIKASAGFIHTVTFSATGTVTAGVITIYDNAAETGTVIWSGIIQAGLNPTTIVLDVSALTAIYVGYDGTIANVATTVSYR